LIVDADPETVWDCAARRLVVLDASELLAIARQAAAAGRQRLYSLDGGNLLIHCPRTLQVLLRIPLKLKYYEMDALGLSAVAGSHGLFASAILDRELAAHVEQWASRN